MRVLVTRPAAQAAVWVQRLQAQGIDAIALPLIDIVPPDDLAPVHDAWQALPQMRLVFFVSPNAVLHFFAARPRVEPWPHGALAASPGPGTTRALQDAGVPATSIVEPAADAPQFDSETLWQQLAPHDWHGAQVLAVRGTSGRDWLADRLREAGATLQFVSAYRRTAPSLSIGEQQVLATVLAQPEAHCWFFSSSEAIDHLATLAPEANWSDAHALVTHPRIAERARRLGFRRVDEARPALESVVACIQSRAS